MDNNELFAQQIAMQQQAFFLLAKLFREHLAGGVPADPLNSATSLVPRKAEEAVKELDTLMGKYQAALGQLALRVAAANAASGIVLPPGFQQ